MLTADRLGGAPIGRLLKSAVAEQLQIIEAKLRRADRTWGRNVVIHDLPIDLAVPGLAKQEAQRIVYASVLRDLVDRGFEVRIQLEDDFSRLLVAWMVDYSAKEEAAMNALISSKRIEGKDVEEFVRHGAIAAPACASTVRENRAPAPRRLVVRETAQEMQPRGGVLGAAGAQGAARAARANKKRQPAPAPGEAAARAPPPPDGISAAERALLNAP